MRIKGLAEALAGRNTRSHEQKESDAKILQTKNLLIDFYNIDPTPENRAKIIELKEQLKKLHEEAETLNKINCIYSDECNHCGSYSIKVGNVLNDGTQNLIEHKPDDCCLERVNEILEMWHEKIKTITQQNFKAQENFEEVKNATLLKTKDPVQREKILYQEFKPQRQEDLRELHKNISTLTEKIKKQNIQPAKAKQEAII